MRLVLASIVLATLATNPCFAKDGRAQHGGHASATNSGASGKGVSGVSLPAAKPNVPIDTEETVAPPVLPPHGPKPQPTRNTNQNPKIVTPGNAPRGQAGGAIAPTPRDAIGQPVVAPKNFAGARPPVPALPRSGAVLPLLVHGGPIAAPVLPGAARVNVATAANRGSVNGTAAIRPSTTPAGVGGPARATNGINGTTVQSRH